MVNKNVLVLLISLMIGNVAAQCADDVPEFEVIILSHNNAPWCIQNLQSAVTQDYPNFHVTYVDDCSTDGTGVMVDEYVQQHNLQKLVRVIHNKKRCGAMTNWYNAISACPDHKIIVNLDGDDMLAHSRVLTKLADVYANYNVWMTYGQFTEWPRGGTGWCKPMPDDVIANNGVRYFRDMPSHLRTFYCWLFKKIKKEDFMHEGKFVAMTCDQAMMFPMMEMAGERYAFISEILYLYNTTNSASDHVADNGRLQSSFSRIIRAKERYARLDKPGIALRADKPLYRK